MPGDCSNIGLQPSPEAVGKPPPPPPPILTEALKVHPTPLPSFYTAIFPVCHLLTLCGSCQIKKKFRLLKVLPPSLRPPPCPPPLPIPFLISAVPAWRLIEGLSRRLAQKGKAYRGCIAGLTSTPSHTEINITPITRVKMGCVALIIKSLLHKECK